MSELLQRRFCAFDTEGEPPRENILGVSVWSDQLQTYFTDPLEALEVLRVHARQNYTFAAHNAAHDIAVLFWSLNEDARVIYYQESFNYGSWHYLGTKRTRPIWDTFPLSGNLSLAQLGASFNLPKYPTPQSLLGLDPDRLKWQCEKHGTWECVECYCLRDAEIVYRFITGYQDFMAGRNLPCERRLGTAAVALWLQADQPGQIALVRKDREKFARKAYVGGRVETYKLGHFEKLYAADVKSMYPYAMLNTPMPDPSNMVLYEGDFIDPGVLNFPGCSEVTLFIPEMYVPPLPVPSHGRLHFPVGTVKGRFSNLEIREALQRGCQVLKIHAVLYSPQSLFPFTSYITQLFELKEWYERHNDPLRQFAKMLLDQLHGRLGLKENIRIETIFPFPAHATTEDQLHKGFRIIRGQSFLIDERMETPQTNTRNVLWAALIAAKARAVLLHYMELQGSSLVYADTDGIMSLSPIVGLSEGIGGLVDLGERYNVQIMGPKAYEYVTPHGERVGRVRGVPATHAHTFLETGEAHYREPVSPREAMIRRIPAGVWIDRSHTRRLELGKRQMAEVYSDVPRDRWIDSRPLVFGPTNSPE